MKLKVLNGKAELEVSDAAFGREFNEALVHQVVNAYRAGARAGTKAQKTRAEVRGGGRKPYAQKGTGQARAGSTRSPIWAGGGRTFAAKPRDHSQKVNRKMYQGAMRSMFSELARQERLYVAEEIALESAKTRLLVNQLRDWKLEDVLIIVEAIEEKLFLAARNLHRVSVLEVGKLNPLALVSHENVVMTTAAVKMIEERLQ